MTTTEEQKNELAEIGATYEKAEDIHGTTRTGWWLDGVYLGKDSKQALAAIKGN